MRTNPLIRPLYAEQFRCIGPDCEDTCCAGWAVSVDEKSCNKYKEIPEGPLRTLLESSVVPTPPQFPGQPAVPGGMFLMLPSGDCPMLTEGRLCRIQAELGEAYLCNTCSTYPRTIHAIDQLQEQPLSLSCPEAARLVLLNPNLIDLNPMGGPAVTWDDQIKGAPLRAFFWVIREFAVRLILNRNYSLWQRIFLLGVFSRRLAAMERGELDRSFGEMLRDFSDVVKAGTLRPAMETIRPDLEGQVKLLLRLLELRAGVAARRATRFQEVLDAFVQGLGESRAICVERYQTAYRDFFLPFSLKHPYLLENYLLNQVFRTKFPVGSQSHAPDGLGIERGYALLVLEFALIKGVLTGVAGHYREKFNSDHVIQAVQVFSRHFEHDPKFLNEALNLLEQQNMNNAQGLTMLVRN